jgi:hypothetical protein
VPLALSVRCAPEASVIWCPTLADVPITAVTVSVRLSGSLSAPVPLLARTLKPSPRKFSLAAKASLCCTGRSSTAITWMPVVTMLLAWLWVRPSSVAQVMVRVRLAP